MFPKIAEIRSARKRYNWQMYQSGSGIFRQAGDLESRALQGGALDQKHKELIALGISISQACYG